MSVRRSIIVLTLVLVILPGVVFGMRLRPADAPVPDRRLQEFTVIRGDVDVTVNAIGRVQPETTARLSFTTPGRVVEVLVEVGDVVQQGDLLARLDDTTQQIAVRQRELALELAQLQKDRALAGPDAAQIAIAQANIDAAEGAVIGAASVANAETVRAAELQYQAALQAVADAEQARASAAGGQSEQAYQLLDARIGQAQFNAEIARLQVEGLRGGATGAQIAAAQARLDQAEAEMDRLMAGPTESEVNRLDAAIRQAQLELEGALAALERTRLFAPFDGLLTAVNVEVGALFAAGLPAFEIADVMPLRLTVQVDEIDVRQIAEGMTATVSFDALPDVDVSGTLERIDLIAQNAAGIVNYDVDVRFDDIDPRVRVGMTAEAAFIVEQRVNTLVVPNEYIRLDRQRDAAFVNVLRTDGSLEEVPVTLGLQGQNVSEIVAGLNEGDVIAVNLAGDALGVFGN